MATLMDRVIYDGPGASAQWWHSMYGNVQTGVLRMDSGEFVTVTVNTSGEIVLARLTSGMYSWRSDGSPVHENPKGETHCSGCGSEYVNGECLACDGDGNPWNPEPCAYSPHLGKVVTLAELIARRASRGGDAA